MLFSTMKAFTFRFLHLTTLLAGFFLFNSVVVYADSAAVTAGRALNLVASVDGSAPFTYQWYKDGSLLSGSTDSIYAISSFQAGNAGTYYTVITNAFGTTTSDNAILTFDATASSAPAFTTQPTSQTVTAGGAVTFTAAASGSPAPTFQWRKDAVAISGATSASYTIASTTTGSAGAYTVVATNSVSAVTSNTATLTIDGATSAPVFTTQPTGQTVMHDDAVTFTSVASGSPTPTYQWRKDGVAISGATNASYSMASVISGNAGAYTVVATNSVGSVTSNTATLIVNTVSAPAFTTQPLSQTVTAGGSVTFTTAASGLPAPTFQWRKSAVNISGATSASYTIASTTTGSAGAYTVVATNTVGAVTSNTATLTVNAATSAPAFTTQPTSQTVTAGGSVTFTAAASGAPAPTFQWRKDGVAISGATSASYTIASITTGSAGAYTVVATNSVSAVTSNTATLTVLMAPSNATVSFAIQ